MTYGTDSFVQIDPESSILFLGSGFSLGATNIAGGSPPNGSGLRRHFLQQLKLSPETTYDLQVLTEEFAERDAQKLRDELYRIFRITKLDAAQHAVLSEPWRRVYTTNYDDVVEIHRLEEKRPPNAFDVSERVPGKLPHGAVVHLHGSIRLVTPENVRDSLVLSDISYVNQYLVKSPWYDQFQRDLAFASALYIIGYSLADYHIAALLLQNPELAVRTVFIQSPEPDSIFLRRTASYGRTEFIGTDGFAEVLKRVPRAEAPSLNTLRAFRPLDPTRDRRPTARPTASEIYDLLIYGNFDPGCLARSQPGEGYAIGRVDKVREAAGSVERNAALVVDGRLGNGKTIFLNLLAFELSKRGWTCLLFRPGHQDAAKEIATLRGVDRLVIFIEQYSASQDAISGLRAALPDAKIVVEIRTGTFEVRYHELADLLPKPFDRVTLNALSRPETVAFGDLCEKAGLPLPTRSKANQPDLRDLLLELFDNLAIRERIEASLSPLFENRVTRRILAMTMLIATYQGSVGAGFVRSVIGADPFVALKPRQDLAYEIFDVSADGFRARSAVFSAFVINAFIALEEISDAVVEITLGAAERKLERPYRILMSHMMAYSSLRRALRGKGDPVHLIVNIYERLRHDDRVNQEPLFWLQYAIAMTEIPKLDAADDYISNAYRKAEALPGFRTFQIDTQAFRIALMRATAEPSGRPISNIDNILRGLERIDAMLTEVSHRSYAVRVLEGIQPFIAARRLDMSPSERTATQFWLYKVAGALAGLSDDFKVISGSDRVRFQVEAAAASFLN